MRYLLSLLLVVSLLNADLLKLRFQGNKSFLDQTLYGILGLRKPTPIELWEDHPAIDLNATGQSISALKSFYRERGFYHTDIEVNASEKDLLFVIHENDPIIVKDIKINSILDVDAAIKLSTDNPFDHEKFSESKSAMKKKYADAGYCNAEFNTKAWIDIETDTAYLLFEATPHESCIFGSIHAESTPNIDGDLTVSMMRFQEGDPYSVEAIQQSYEALYNQEGIARVIINDNERNGSIVPITLTIEEDEQPIRFTAGLGYSTDEGATVQAGLKHRNFFGNLKTLSLDTRISQIRREASGSFGLPLRNRGLIGAEVGYSDEQFDGYKSESIYEKLTAKYQDAPASALAGFLVDQVTTYQSKDTEAFPNNRLFIVSPMGEINVDTRDKPLQPTKGYWLNAKMTGSLKTPTLSDATYFKSLLSGAYITGIDEHVFATKLKWGTLRLYDGAIPASYHFYAGGMHSNRAYQYRELGPKNSAGDPIGFNSLIEGTAEYRFPLYQAFRGVVFGDLTFASRKAIPDYANEAYPAVGVGLRYVTPIGPVAIDFGIDPEDTDQYAIQFRIGELF